MIRKKYKVDFNNISTILHVSDIHIRNFKRHKEYRSIFKKLYKQARELPENSIIYIGGDIVHNKTDISPELLSLTSEFLNSLANIRKTILIAGNHDANLNNKSRLDSLSPIVENLANPNLYYLRDTGVYSFADVDFIVMKYALKRLPNSVLAKVIKETKNAIEEVKEEIKEEKRKKKEERDV